MVDVLLVTVAVSLVGLFPGVLILSLRLQNARRWSVGLAAYRLQLPSDIDHKAVEAFLNGLSSLRPEGWQRVIATWGVIFKVTASEAGIVHRLLIDHQHYDLVASHLRATLPGAGLIPDPEYQLATPTLAGELETPQRHRQLRIDQPSIVAGAILAALQPLTAGETMVVQWTIAPVAAHAPTPTVGPWWQTALGFKTAEPSTVDIKSQRDKYSRTLFQACGRIGVTSASVARSRQLLGRLSGSFHQANSSNARLRRRRVSSSASIRSLMLRRLPMLTWPCLLNSAELAGLVAWPGAGSSLPGLNLGSTRLLAPSSEILRSGGRVVADATFPGLARPLAISAIDALSHCYVIGPTGVGKSTLLNNCIVQDLEAGHGVVAVDAKGDLITDLLSRIPASRTNDVVVLNPADDAFPVGLNLLAGGISTPELTAEQVLTTFRKIYAASWGARTDDVLRASLLTLVSVPGMTLAEVPLILVDATFRRRIISQLDDPVGLGPFWSWYEGLREAERTQVIGPVLNKLRAVLVRPRLRRVLGQVDPRLDFDDLLSTSKVLLVQLPKGLLGEDAASLIGSLLIARLWQAVQRRARQPQSDRRPVYCYIDEFQDFLSIPTPIPDLLAQARGLGLGLTLAHQNLAQLTPEIKEQVLANCRSKIIFQVAASDAQRLAREVAPYLTASDLQGLGPHEVVASLSAGARVAPPVTGRTRPMPPLTSDPATLRERSRQHYGRPAAEVDAELRLRHQPQPDTGPIGQGRRSA